MRDKVDNTEYYKSWLEIIVYTSAVVLIFLTFYILKKCNVNIEASLKINIKESKEIPKIRNFYLGDIFL